MEKQLIYRSPTWSCPIHGGFGSLNLCAWPNCEYGILEDSVETKSQPGISAAIFQRVSWHDLNGDDYHDWQTNEMPTWFSIGRPFHYFSNLIKNNEKIHQVFHYTSVDGALAIINSGRLRFTDYSYLNDTREIAHGIDVIRSVLGEDKQTTGSCALTRLMSHLEYIDPFEAYQIYTASFSTQDDSLSQFRLYGPVALGFEANPMGFGSFKGDICHDYVVYDPDKQACLIETFFHLLKQSERMDAELIASDESKRVNLETLVSRLLGIIAFFKHPAFSDERVVRFMYSEPLSILEELGREVAIRQFRSSGGLIIPFTDTFDMSNVKDTGLSPKLPLKSVVIGPTAQAQTLARGMRGFLSANGYEDVKVFVSEAPFRN